VAEKHHVRYVLEGGVRKSGNRVRITERLIDATTESHLWAEQYDRLVDDVFALQDEIAMCVIGAIEPSLRRVEMERVKRQRPENLDAYDFVLRSLPFVYAQMPKDSAIAIPLLEEALKLEPSYGAAHALLSFCLHAKWARGGLHQKDRISAIQHARAAIALGNDDATALATAAFVIALDDHDTTTALKLFDGALDLSSSNIFALNFSATTLAWMGKTDLAAERAQQALRLSPFDTITRCWAYHALAIAHFHASRYSDAATAARSAIDSNPAFSVPRAVLVAALVGLGRVDEARVATQSLLEHEPSFTIAGLSQVTELEPAVFRRLAAAWREVGLLE